jgi:hypothetical protein
MLQAAGESAYNLLRGYCTTFVTFTRPGLAVPLTTAPQGWQSVGVLASTRACGGAALSSDDRGKFIGNWVGSYRCESIRVEPVPDTVVIARGSGDLDFVITLHADFLNPDIANGKLTDIDVITVPTQNMGGCSRYSKNHLFKERANTNSSRLWDSL